MNHKPKESQRGLRDHEREVLFSFFTKVAPIPLNEFSDFEKIVYARDFRKGEFFVRSGVMFPTKNGLGFPDIFKVSEDVSSQIKISALSLWNAYL